MNTMLACCLGLVLAGGDADWQEFTWKEGQCKILLPGTPKVRTRTTGDTPFVMLSVEKKGEVFGVMYNTIPALPEETEARKQLRLDVSRDLVLKATRGKLLVDRKLSLDGHPGREIQVEGKDGLYRLRVFLVGDRLYQVQHFGPRDLVLSKAGDRFFESFQVTEPKPADPTQAASSFRATFSSLMETKGPAKRAKTHVDSECRYTWQRSGKDRTLVLDSVDLRATRDGQETANTFLSRAKFVTTEQGQTREVLFADAPAELKQVLQDSFGVPLVKLQLDDDGRVVKRTVVAGAGAKGLFQGGSITNTFLFHPPPPPPARDAWDADAEFDTGFGVTVHGKLTYQAAGKGNTYQVSGTLAGAEKRPDSAATVKARYTVTGELTYHPGLREWVLGELTLVVSVQEVVDGTVVGSARGAILATCERLPGKK
jgi:hypothetical protein